MLYKKNGVWSVIKEKDRRATSNHSIKKAAVEDVKRIAKAVPANVIVVIHKKDGTVQAEYNYRNESAQ